MNAIKSLNDHSPQLYNFDIYVYSVKENIGSINYRKYELQEYFAHLPTPYFILIVY